MTGARKSQPLQRIEFRNSLSYFTINQPLSAPFSRNAAITRSCSASRVTDYKEILRDKRRPVPHLCKYFENNQWDNDYWFDEYSLTPKFWPTYTRARQHFNKCTVYQTCIFSVPSYDYFFYYPARTLYPRFKRWSWADSLDVRYWRHYRDPYYDNPLWFPHRPWVYETRDAQKAVQMYRKNLIDLQALAKYWLNPYLHECKQGYTSYLQRPIFWPNYPRPKSHFYDTTVY